MSQTLEPICHTASRVDARRSLVSHRGTLIGGPLDAPRPVQAVGEAPLHSRTAEQPPWASTARAPGARA